MNKKLKPEKKRIAHIGRLSKVSFEGELELPPDDIVYNIMKDMDSRKDIISYNKLQELRSRHTSKGCKPSLSSNSLLENDELAASKQTKKNFPPEKMHPLMAKCQKSLKYLKKNRCIPKPRAHVGVIPRPPKQPILPVEQNVSRCKGKASSKVIKSKSCKNKASKPDLKSHKITQKASCSRIESSNSVFQTDIENHLSNSDVDADNAFESFLQKHVEKPTGYCSSDSEVRSSSRRRKKSKKLKKKHGSISDKRLKMNICKVTSIPLPDSSESEPPVTKEKDATKMKMVIGTDKSTKHKQGSPDRSNKKCSKNNEVKDYNCDLSDEQSRGLDTFNSDSSDSLNLEHTEELVFEDNLGNQDMQTLYHSKLNIHKNTTENELIVNDTSMPNSDSTSNDLVTNGFESVKKSKNFVSCSVLLERDLDLDYKAQTLYTGIDSSTSNTIADTTFEDEDCVVISDNTKSNFTQNTSDHGNIFSRSDSWHSTLSPKTCELSDRLKNTTRGLTSNNFIPKAAVSNSKSPIDTGDLSPEDKCVIMYQMHKTNLSNSTVEAGVRNSLSFNNLSQIPEPSSIPESSNSKNYLMDSNTEVTRKIPVLENTANIHDLRCNSNLVEPAAAFIESSNVQAESKYKCVGVSECNPTDKTSDFRNNENSLVSSPLMNSHSDHAAKLSRSKSPSERNSGIEENLPLSSKPLGENIETQGFNVKIVSVQSLKELKAVEIVDLSDDDMKDLETTVQTDTIKSIEDFSKLETLQLNEFEDSDIEIVLDDTLDTSKNIPISNAVLNRNHKLENGSLPTSNERGLGLSNEKLTDDCMVLNEKVVQKQVICEQISENSHIHSPQKNTVHIQDPSIFEILNKIDFNCIKEVLKKTALNNSEAIVINNSFEKTSVIQNESSPSPVEHKLPFQVTQSPSLPSRRKAQSPDEQNVPSTAGQNTQSCVGSINDPLNTSLERGYFIKEGLGETVTVNDIEMKKTESPKLSLRERNECKNFTALKCNNFGSDDCLSSKSKIDEHNNYEQQEHNIFSDYSKTSDKLTHTLSKTEISNKCDSNLSHDQTLNIESGSKPILKTTFLPNDTTVKIETDIESPSDELDVIATSFIHDLNQRKNLEVIPLLELYKSEFKRYLEIKHTGKNVSAGLKLLEEKQTKKLTHLCSSIKNLVKHDPCFYKIVNQVQCHKDCFEDVKIKNENINMSSVVKVVNPEKVISETDSDNCMKKNHSLEENVQEFTSSNASGPSSRKRELSHHMINIRCAECGKHATGRCQGCGKVYYCSTECGEISWNRGHSAACR